MDNKFEIAWNRAIPYTNLDSKQYRMCYWCKEVMHHGNVWNSGIDPKDGVNIDHINGNHNDNNEKNLVVVHYKCNVEKGSRDGSSLYNERIQKSWTWNK